MKKIKILFGISLIVNVVLLASLIYSNRNIFLYEEVIDDEDVVDVVEVYEEKHEEEVISNEKEEILYVETPHITMTKSQFELLPESKADIVFAGDSITEFGWWDEWFPNHKVKNRGISGDVVQGVLYRIDGISVLSPKQVFLMIGINDIIQEHSIEHIKDSYLHLCEKMSKEMPNTQIYLQSILPTNSDEKNVQIHDVNEEICRLAGEFGFEYIDLYSLFIDSEGLLKEGYSLDGVHLSGEAYLAWVDELTNYIED